MICTNFRTLDSFTVQSATAIAELWFDLLYFPYIKQHNKEQFLTTLSIRVQPQEAFTIFNKGSTNRHRPLIFVQL